MPHRECTDEQTCALGLTKKEYHKQYYKSWYEKNKGLRAEQNKALYEATKDKQSEQAKQRYMRDMACPDTKLKRRESSRNAKLRRKLRVLSHYSLFKSVDGIGIPQCTWPGCGIADIDMLCLDHIDDGGSNHRKEIGGGGHNTYA